MSINVHVPNAERFVGHYVILVKVRYGISTYSDDANKEYMKRRMGDRVVHQISEVFFFESFIVKTNTRADITLIDSDLRKRYLYLDDLFTYDGGIDNKLNNMFQTID